MRTCKRTCISLRPEEQIPKQHFWQLSGFHLVFFLNLSHYYSINTILIHVPTIYFIKFERKYTEALLFQTSLHLLIFKTKLYDQYRNKMTHTSVLKNHETTQFSISQKRVICHHQSSSQSTETWRVGLFWRQFSVTVECTSWNAELQRRLPVQFCICSRDPN